MIGTGCIWFPFVVEWIPTQQPIQQPSQTAYPTYTLFPTYQALPTYTLLVTREPEWIWTELFFHHIPVYIPEDWSVLPINHRWERDPYGPVGSGSKECEDYLIIGPDGKQIIIATFVCWEGEGIGGPCPDDIQVFADLGNNEYLYRWPNSEDNTFTYGKTIYGEWTWVTPRGSGYWCMSENPIPYVFRVMGKSYDEITDFSTVDLIMQSLLVNIP
jgi:hypothetical protein